MKFLSVCLRRAPRWTLAIGSLVFGLVWFDAARAHPRHQAGHNAPQSAPTLLNEVDQARLDELTAELKKDPKNAEAAAAFARFAAIEARRNGDTSLLRRAAESLKPWREIKTPPIDILLIRANVKQIDHRFEEALSDLDEVIARSPANPQARLSRAFIRSTVGQAEWAAADCAALRPGISIYIRETCRARVSGLTGAIDEAATRMTALLNAVQPSSVAERLFALSVASDLVERLGDDDIAEAFYKEMLSLDSASVYARAAYADFLISQDRRDEAQEVIGDAPHTEALLLLRTLAANTDEDSLAKSAAQELSIRMAVDRAEQDFSHAREYARFALDHLNDADLAFEMAQENWRVQKEPIDARILVRSARAAGSPEIVEEIRDWTAKTGLQDKTLQALLAL